MKRHIAFFSCSLLLFAQSAFSSAATIELTDTQKPLVDTQKPLVVILFGPPRSGQGVLAVKAAQSLAIPHISAANLLYQQMSEGTEIGQQAREYINCRGSIPDCLILQMLYERIKQENNKPAFLLDHMPRTHEQAIELKKVLGDQYRFLVISIRVPDQTLLLKAEVRLICESCGRVYHMQFSPPEKPNTCDHCGATLIKREDDSPENVKRRLEDYRKSVEPILAFYRTEGALTEVNGNCPLENTLDEIKMLFRQNTSPLGS